MSINKSLVITKDVIGKSKRLNTTNIKFKKKNNFKKNLSQLILISQTRCLSDATIINK
jgi:hypothetical protein